MGTLVLFLLVAAVTGGSAGLRRRRFQSGRAAEAHHRALDTMGRLAARHADDHGSPTRDYGPPSDGADPQPTGPVTPGRSVGQAHVRLVPAGADAIAGNRRVEATPPRLRSRPRHGTEPRSPSVGSADRAARTVRPTAQPTIAAPPIRSADRPVQDPAEVSGEHLEDEWPAEPIVLVFDDAEPFRPPHAGAAGHYRDRHRRRDRDQARPGRRLGARINGRSPLVLAVAIVALIGASLTVGILVGRSGHRAPRTGSSGQSGHSTHPIISNPARSSTPDLSSAAASRTPPIAGPSATLVSTSSGFALYRLGPSGTVTIAASAPCWIEVRTGGPTGTVTFEGTLVAGGTHAIGGPAWIRLGNPMAATITVNGSALHPPGFESGQPYDVQFE